MTAAPRSAIAVIDDVIAQAKQRDPDDVGAWLDVSETALRLIAAGHAPKADGTPIRMGRDTCREIAERACAFLKLNTSPQGVLRDLYGVTKQ